MPPSRAALFGRIALGLVGVALAVGAVRSQSGLLLAGVIVAIAAVVIAVARKRGSVMPWSVSQRGKGQSEQDPPQTFARRHPQLAGVIVVAVAMIGGLAVYPFAKALGLGVAGGLALGTAWWLNRA